VKYPKFDADGLVPAIAQDARSGRILMQAYMSKDAYEQTLETGFAVYYSRSRKSLWRKGETSGNTQRVAAVYLDCDADSVLLKVIQTGVACHTGQETCYHDEVKVFEQTASADVLYDEAAVIRDRNQTPVEGSYTNYLLAKGIDKICKKIGEETAEIIIAAKNTDNAELSGEIADLIFHIQVLMEERGLTLEDVLTVIKDRRDSERKRNYK